MIFLHRSYDLIDSEKLRPYSTAKKTRLMDSI